MKIVIHSNAAWGGIVDYMIWQANAMAAFDCEVILLVPVNFEKAVDQRVKVLPVLPNLEDENESSKLLRRMRWVTGTLRSWKITAVEISRIKPDIFLLSAFAEYLSPFWKHHFFRLRRKLPQLKIGAIVHDPVRLAFGPKLFHQHSVRSAYEILDAAFIHSPIELDQAGASPPVSVHLIPFGVYNFPDSNTPPKETRERLGITQGNKLIFAFGHIRDSKNLDLAIEMLGKFPDMRLLIAGKVMSSRDRPVSFYRKTAEKCGVQDQLIILDKFIPDEEAADFFEASDVVLLSYDGNFVSASSVLHVALKFRKPVLATSGDGHLKWAVEKYGLGIWTEPDSEEALSSGLNQLMHKHFTPRWEDYEAENTWAENARRVISTFSYLADSHKAP